MSEDPLPGWGLRPVELADQATLAPYLRSLRQPLSDYTFSQLYCWRNSLHLLWKIIRGHLCVFANGAGDLTLLVPPMGDDGGGGGGDAALAEAFELMNEYNHLHAKPGRSRVEYVSEELLSRFSVNRFEIEPMGSGDYVYDVHRMIDLAGGDLASKRQAKNRFMRNYRYRVEAYDAPRHLEDCRLLLRQWKSHQDASHANDDGADGAGGASAIPAAASGALKRQKEAMATNLTLQYAEQLGLRGMVVYVADEQGESVRGFTFGENLGPDQSSIVIEKTDLNVKGLAQFIFSEFCRAEWSARPLVNAGDDWGLESLAWTKASYRPVRMLRKFVLRQRECRVALPPARPAIEIRPARADDLRAVAALEQACFDVYALSEQRLRTLLDRGAIAMVATDECGQVLGQGIALLHRRRRDGIVGRIFTLAVNPAHRGQKLGQRLMTLMVDELRSRGAQRVRLEVEQSNFTALRLYEQLGFRVVGTLPDYYGPGRAGVQMLLTLEQPTILVPAA